MLTSPGSSARALTAVAGADAGDDVFALRVDQEFAVQDVLAGRRDRG